MIKVFLYPEFNTPDAGDGGVRRVVEAQLAYCPKYGVEFVTKPEDADVIAAHIQIPDEFLRRFSQKPIVTHVHGFYWDEYKMPDGTSQWEKWSLQANIDVMRATLVADIVTAPSEWVAQSIRRNTCRDVRVVPHGINLDDWIPHEPESRKYVLWNKSRPDPVCDPEPVYQLAQLMPGTQFVSTYGGWSMDKPPLNVQLTGRVPYVEAKRWVEGANIYLATTRETFGIGTLEPMAAGVPVVGWKWGGQREFITHKVDGWLAQPHDIEGLKAGIEWAQQNRPTVAAAARKTAERFTWDGPAKMYADIWKEAAARRLPPSPGALKGGVWLTDKPKVTVLVTAYNLDKYLDVTLASVLKQDDEYKDWECVIVDDASPDRCGEIADAWAKRDARFRVLHNETNLYLAGARNAGIKMARGEYIIPLDADDMLGPGALKILADALDADRQTYVAYGGVLFVDEDGVTPTNYQHPDGPGRSGWPLDFRVDWQLRAPQDGRRPNNLLPYSSMIRREALELTGGYRERRRTAEDADLWCRLSSYGFTPRRITNAACLIYRNRPESMSRINEPDDWTMWYPWSRLPDLTPAGAMLGANNNALAVSSCDPPIIAVIIPVGPGHERLLMDAIDSVDSQTFRQFECIVVNDTGKPLPWLPTWVRVLQDAGGVRAATPGNPLDGYERMPIGPARARNMGIRAAVARLYIPLDADDMLRPHALRAMYEALRAEDGGPDAGKSIIYADFWEDPEVEGDFRVFELPDFQPQFREDGSHMIGDHMMGCVTQLTPVAAWEKVGGYDETLPAWEDWDFQIKLCAEGYCMKHVAVPLWTYRKHTGSRRDEQYANRDVPGGAKDMMIARYPDMWPNEAQARGLPLTGRNPLAPCSSCGGGSAQPTLNINDQTPKRLNPQASGAMLVEYIGLSQGGMEYRANTEAIYRFSLGDDAVKYVHPDDLNYFLMRDDFRIIEGSQASGPEPVFAPPQPLDGPVGVSDEPASEAEEVAQNEAALAEKKARTRKKAGTLPAGVAEA